MFIMFSKIQLFFLVFLVQNVVGSIYDYYSGDIVPPEYVLRYAHTDKFRECTVEIPECKPAEGRRVDGSCNNIHHPTRGMQKTPYGYMVPPYFGPNNTIMAFAPDGTKLPLPRRIRTTLQPSIHVVSKRFSMALLHLGGFTTLDVTKIASIANYLIEKTDCCTPAGENDPKCMPIHVPKDDPYMKHTGVRCMNLTRAQSFQEIGCLTNENPSATINWQTPLLDLSPIYGSNASLGNSLRQFEKGQLKMEFRKKRYVPGGEGSICYANRRDDQPCYELGDSSLNFQPKIMLFGIYFARNHNQLASQLALINRCWNDEQLYQAARQINIAMYQQIIFYEMFPLLLGRENMIKHGLLATKKGYVNSYNPKEPPRTNAEFEIGFRALHSLLDDTFGLYDKKAELTAVTSLNQWLFGVGVLEDKKNMEEMGRSLYYQACSDSMLYADPGLSNNMYTRFQKANDLFTIDLLRGRDLGIGFYNKYRKVCGLPVAHKFEDFADTIDDEHVHSLKELYHSVDAVEMTAGTRVEREMPGAAVGPTLYCLLAEQLRIYRDSDRFWFENGEQKIRLTPDQLAEIRKYSLARLACDTNDGLEYIQPRAFETVSEHNELVKCHEIPKLDLRHWRDDHCMLAQGRAG